MKFFLLRTLTGTFTAGIFFGIYLMVRASMAKSVTLWQWGVFLTVFNLILLFLSAGRFIRKDSK